MLNSSSVTGHGKHFKNLVFGGGSCENLYAMLCERHHFKKPIFFHWLMLENNFLPWNLDKFWKNVYFEHQLKVPACSYELGTQSTY